MRMTRNPVPIFPCLEKTSRRQQCELGIVRNAIDQDSPNVRAAKIPNRIEFVRMIVDHDYPFVPIPQTLNDLGLLVFLMREEELVEVGIDSCTGELILLPVGIAEGQEHQSMPFTPPAFQTSFHVGKKISFQVREFLPEHSYDTINIERPASPSVHFSHVTTERVTRTAGCRIRPIPKLKINAEPGEFVANIDLKQLVGVEQGVIKVQKKRFFFHCDSRELPPLYVNADHFAIKVRLGSRGTMSGMKLPHPIERVANKLAELPSIGPRQAIRLAFYLIGQNKDGIHDLAASIDELRNIKICERCFFIHQNEPTLGVDGTSESLCDICRNPNRNQRAIMVVEKETDLVSLENTGKFTGRYFIIGEITKTGILEDWQKARLTALKNFITKNLSGQADELIFAFNPTSLGDLQTSLLAKELAPLAKKNSRLGRGLPTGGEIEFADDQTLGSALDRRS